MATWAEGVRSSTRYRHAVVAPLATLTGASGIGDRLGPAYAHSGATGVVRREVLQAGDAVSGDAGLRGVVTGLARCIVNLWRRVTSPRPLRILKCCLGVQSSRSCRPPR